MPQKCAIFCKYFEADTPKQLCDKINSWFFHHEGWFVKFDVKLNETGSWVAYIVVADDPDI